MLNNCKRTKLVSIYSSFSGIYKILQLLLWQNHHLTYYALWNNGFQLSSRKMFADFSEMNEIQMIISYRQVLCILYFVHQNMKSKVLIIRFFRRIRSFSFWELVWKYDWSWDHPGNSSGSVVIFCIHSSSCLFRSKVVPEQTNLQPLSHHRF